MGGNEKCGPAPRNFKRTIGQLELPDLYDYEKRQQLPCSICSQLTNFTISYNVQNIRIERSQSETTRQLNER